MKRDEELNVWFMDNGMPQYSKHNAVDFRAFINAFNQHSTALLKVFYKTEVLVHNDRENIRSYMVNPQIGKKMKEDDNKLRIGVTIIDPKTGEIVKQKDTPIAKKVVYDYSVNPKGEIRKPPQPKPKQQAKIPTRKI